MDPQSPFVIYETAGAVRRITLNRPAQRNALSLGMLDALRMEIQAAQADPDVNVIVLAAEGPAFSAGHDLKELTAARAAPDGGAGFFKDTFDACAEVMLCIAEGPKPVIAEVHGIATAAGCQLVASCDLAYAADTARFATPGLNIGLFCSTPAVALTRAVPAKAAMEMLLTGDAIDAHTALSLGLINGVVPAVDLTAATMAMAAKIASKPPEIVAFGRRAVREQRGRGLSEAYAIAGAAMAENLMFGEAIDGIAAFLKPKQR